MAEATKEPGKKPIDRVIRVFVSSTFVDMHAEREELVKRVFPELRRRCDSRGVVWSEVDLRWGVTWRSRPAAPTPRLPARWARRR